MTTIANKEPWLDSNPDPLQNRDWPDRYRTCKCFLPIRSGTRYEGFEKCKRCGFLIGTEGSRV